MGNKIRPESRSMYQLHLSFLRFRPSGLVNFDVKLVDFFCLFEKPRHSLVHSSWWNNPFSVPIKNFIVLYLFSECLRSFWAVSWSINPLYQNLGCPWEIDSLEGPLRVDFRNGYSYVLCYFTKKQNTVNQCVVIYWQYG